MKKKKELEPHRWDSLDLKSGACSPHRQSAVLMHWESDLSPPGRSEMPEGQAVGLSPEKDMGGAWQCPKGWPLSPGRRSSWWVNTGNPLGEVFLAGRGWAAVIQKDWLMAWSFWFSFCFVLKLEVAASKWTLRKWRILPHLVPFWSL